MFPPGFEPGTFRVLGERDNRYTTETPHRLLAVSGPLHCFLLRERKQCQRSALHWPGIGPGSPAWQARILPLNHQCLWGSVRGHSFKPHPKPVGHAHMFKPSPLCGRNRRLPGVQDKHLQSGDCPITHIVLFCPALHTAQGSLVSPPGCALPTRPKREPGSPPGRRRTLGVRRERGCQGPASDVSSAARV